MKFAAWLACWPLLGFFGVLAIFTDSLIDLCEMTDRVLDKLENYVDAA